MIPTDANFKSVSTQLGGLTLNGIAAQGTAQSLVVLNIDDTLAAQTLSKTITTKFIQVKIDKTDYYIPLYQ
jgi:hypothetical protein